MQTRKSKNWILWLIGIFILVTIFVGTITHITQQWIVIVAILSSLLLGYLAIWMHATRKADGSEWWQDDTSSGWRGY